MSMCPNCGDEIPPKPVGRVGQVRTYCSVRCRSAAQKVREHAAVAWDRSPRPCEVCGTLFAPTTAHHACCSVPCRKKRENRRRFHGSGSNSNYYRSLFVEERGGVCERCGVSDGLEVHHIVSVAAGGLHRAANVLVLCKGCHGIVERSPEQSTDL
jgi:5-methylcytosine-specific restriction endonuclease McrA